MTLKINSTSVVVRDQIREFLDKLCPSAKLKVANDGSVAPEQNTFCARTDPPLTGECKCICDAVQSPKNIYIQDTDTDLAAFGGDGGVTFPMDAKGASDGSGSDAIIRIDTLPHTEKKNQPEKHEVLQKQLCAHAVPITKGIHKKVGAEPAKEGGTAAIATPNPTKK
jgi:hypothetical protein